MEGSKQSTFSHRIVLEPRGGRLWVCCGDDSVRMIPDVLLGFAARHDDELHALPLPGLRRSPWWQVRFQRLSYVKFMISTVPYVAHARPHVRSVTVSVDGDVVRGLPTRIVNGRVLVALLGTRRTSFTSSVLVDLRADEKSALGAYLFERMGSSLSYDLGDHATTIMRISYYPKMVIVSAKQFVGSFVVRTVSTMYVNRVGVSQRYGLENSDVRLVDVGGVAYVPLRLYARFVGANVSWNSAARRVLVTVSLASPMELVAKTKFEKSIGIDPEKSSTILDRASKRLL